MASGARIVSFIIASPASVAGSVIPLLMGHSPGRTTTAGAAVGALGTETDNRVACFACGICEAVKNNVVGVFFFLGGGVEVHEVKKIVY